MTSPRLFIPVALCVVLFTACQSTNSQKSVAVPVNDLDSRSPQKSGQNYCVNYCEIDFEAVDDSYEQGLIIANIVTDLNCRFQSQGKETRFAFQSPYLFATDNGTDYSVVAIFDGATESFQETSDSVSYCDYQPLGYVGPYEALRPPVQRP